MTDKELQNISYEEIESITKKQTTPIILAIIGVIVISFLFTNIPRVINTNFYDINSDDLISISINHHYYSNQLNKYEQVNTTILRDSETFDKIVSTISKYDYNVIAQTFMGFQSGFGTSGDIMSLFFNYGDSFKSVSLYNNRVQVDNIAYKMDSDKVNTLISEISSYVAKGE